MKYKHELNHLGLIDYIGVQEHLQKRAAEGWILESVKQNIWKYRKDEPQKLTYSVTYVPDISAFDPFPTEKQQAMMDICGEAGWQYVCDWIQMQIFCTTEENPVPIDTDESIRLEIISKSVMKNYRFSYPLMILSFGLMLMTRIMSFRSNPLNTLSDNAGLFSALMLLWAIILMSYDWFYFRYWKKASEKSIANGGSCIRPKHNRLVFAVSWGVLILLLIAMLISSGVKYSQFMMVYLLGMCVVFAGTWGTSNALKKKGASKGVNLALTLLVDFVLVFALVGVSIWVGISTSLFSHDDAPETYTITLSDGRTHEWSIYHDDIPLRVEDLMDVSYEHYSTYSSGDSSFLLSVTDYDQFHPPIGEPIPDMCYTVYHVKADFLYDYVLEQIEKREMRHYDEISKANSGYRSIDHKPWNADAVYQWEFGDEAGSVMDEKYLICKDDYIIELIPGFELLDQHKAIITEKITG